MNYNISSSIVAGLMAVACLYAYFLMTHPHEDFVRGTRLIAQPSGHKHLPSSLRGRPTHYKLLPACVLIALQLADFLSTRLALSGGAVELNPMVAIAGLWQAKLVALALAGLLVWRAKSMKRVWIVCGLYGLIVISNLRLLAMLP